MKRLFILVFLLAVSTASFAQLEGPNAQPVNHNLLNGSDATNDGFGFKGGANFASMSGSDKNLLGSISGITSFHAGAFAQFAFNNFFSLQPEVLYSRKGYERSDSTFRFDYLEVPLLAVFNITQNVSVHFGPQASVMISAKEEDKEIDLEPFNTFDYGIAAGGEARISRFRLGARYNLGLADLRNQDTLEQKINQDIKHGVFQVYLSVGF
ncbi:porin family protein [Pontibacter ruber]|uniref:Porin family protein n=1 Tax=Pontibacter ruber TaxID=1343895 RepID=A0ABW5CWM2_9BACT|nr:porin family protein [Pontibacter ruber]